MNDNTMPERIYAGYGILGASQQWFEVERVHFGRTTEYIRADVAAAQLDAANARIAELEAVQQWVSVDERLPDDESKSQLAWTDNDGTVTHWMPLPPPPHTGLKAMEEQGE